MSNLFIDGPGGQERDNILERDEYLQGQKVQNANVNKLKKNHPIQSFFVQNLSPDLQQTLLQQWNREEILKHPERYKSYIVPPQADQVAFYNEYLDRAKSLLNRETPDERYERNRKELEQPMTPRERIQRLREMELMRQQFPDIGGIV